jgi:hypothetical protein
MLCKQYNSKALDAKIPFIDIESGAWYTDYIAIAYSNGLVNGYNDKFYPNNPITREEMATLVYRFALKSGKTFLDTGREIIYTDYDEISDYAKEAISKMSSCGFISGIGNGLIAPKNYANRAETATIIYKMR